ncbi:hypothetical protein J6590_001568 [Homalodisca vitripennis]|nr:hypothetical protein J6590_001568 [Homalodisca vitripennis]
MNRIALRWTSGAVAKLGNRVANIGPVYFEIQFKVGVGRSLKVLQARLRGVSSTNIPFQQYLFGTSAYILLNPLEPTSVQHPPDRARQDRWLSNLSRGAL